ncbi:unnamed protein product [Moneuplotes crassus]|uniref:Uncharacterized protein n=1 Tax=Euplotes crassus TaxID=5936 RepID=A0AAD2D3N2_EUPCR|nr:unnamed protein product [Moneuplotes crassus]
MESQKKRTEREILEESRKIEFLMSRIAKFSLFYEAYRAIDDMGDFETESHHQECINIGFNSCRDFDLVKLLMPLVHYNVMVIDFYNCSKRNKWILKFLRNSFPNQVYRFVLDSASPFGDSISYYFGDVIRISSKIQKEILLNKFCISFSQFKRLITAYKHLESVKITSCKLSIPTVADLHLALKNTHIQELDLYFCGAPKLSNWKDNPQEFKNLIKGLSTSEHLKTSLSKLTLKGCYIPHHKAEHLLLNTGFNPKILTT